MSVIALSLDKSEIDWIVDQLGGTDKNVRLALRSTISKMGQWLRTRAGRAVRGETGIDFKTLRKRFRAIRFRRTASGGISGVWIGLNPIDLKLLNPSQDSKGVTAGPGKDRRENAGAFMGPRPGVLASKLRGGAFKRRGRARLKIDRLGYDIVDQGERALQSEVMELAAFEAQFYRVLERELKWRNSKSI